MTFSKALTPVTTCLIISSICYIFTSCHKDNKPFPPTPKADSPAVWTRITTLPQERITALEIIDGIIYAGSSSSGKIFISTDEGLHWKSSSVISPDIEIKALAVFKNKIYVGAFHDNAVILSNNDIYSSNDDGNTWMNAGTGNEALSFTVWNNNLYCSSYDAAQGIFMLDTVTNKWIPFTNGLSSILGSRTTKIMTADDDLIAGTIDFFAAYDAKQQVWIQKDYSIPQIRISLFPNYVIDMMYDKPTLFVQIYLGRKNQQTIIRTDDLGATWRPDSAQLKVDTGNDDKYIMRGLLAGAGKYYVITNQEQGLTGAWIQQRDKHAPAGTTWANGEQFLPGLHCYAIRELNKKLYLATDNGILTAHSHT